MTREAHEGSKCLSCFEIRNKTVQSKLWMPALPQAGPAARQGFSFLCESDIARGYQLIRAGKAVILGMEVCHHVEVEVADKTSAGIPAAGSF